MASDATAPTSTMRSLERAIDVLEILDESHHALRLTDIARRADLPVATTQRILGVLEGRGRIERDGTGYRPGVGLIFGAHAYLTSSPLVLAARPVLQELAEETGLTASLFRRVGSHRVVLARVDGSRPLRYEIPIGERLPLHLGAGKAICSAMSPDELQRYLAEVPEIVRADGSVRVPAEFEHELSEIRAQGYSTATGERVPGMTSVAAPVPSVDGPVVAAVQVSGTTEEVGDQRIEALGIETRRAAYAVAQRMG